MSQDTTSPTTTSPASQRIKRPLSLKNAVKKQQNLLFFTRTHLGEHDEADSIRTCRNKCEIYFLHPYSRLFFAFGIILMNFLIFAEDPVAHSVLEADLPIIGNGYSMVVRKYPSNGTQVFSKIFLWIFFMLSGAIFSRQVIHGIILRDWRKIPMFFGSKGTWFIMFLFNFIILFVASAIYNSLIHKMGWNASTIIDGRLGMSYSSFAKVAATGTWLGDFVTAAMVTDMMLQSTATYYFWATKLRKWWNEAYNGYGRIIVFWFIAVITTIIFFIVILNPNIFNWDEINPTKLSSSELGRAWLAAIITMFDLIIVIQDWEFPWFENEMSIKLPGVNFESIECECLERLPQFCQILITGKWFNYGIIIIVMLLDFNMYKNQIVYVPSDFMQYVDNNNKIWTVIDQFDIDYLTNGHMNELTWDIRQGAVSNDIPTNSEYVGYGNIIMLTSFIPIIFGIVLLFYLIHKDRPLNRKGLIPVQGKPAVELKNEEEEKELPDESLLKSPPSVLVSLRKENELQNTLLSYKKARNKHKLAKGESFELKRVVLESPTGMSSPHRSRRKKLEKLEREAESERNSMKIKYSNNEGNNLAEDIIKEEDDEDNYGHADKKKAAWASPKSKSPNRSPKKPLTRMEALRMQAFHNTNESPFGDDNDKNDHNNRGDINSAKVSPE